MLHPHLVTLVHNSFSPLFCPFLCLGSSLALLSSLVLLALRPFLLLLCAFLCRTERRIGQRLGALEATGDPAGG